ncbi:MAG: PadR family transcriptional regulator [Candidatus Thorarchaeota archaeon]|nr:PadR family transcriptional regulator [Candidatus Thorarchaeota archaeon]
MTKHKEQSKDDEMIDILSDFSQFYIILMLSEGPNHGYGLIKAFKERTGKNLSAGTLYPFLHKLQEKGLVSQVDKPVGKKPRTIYNLTKMGKKFCERLFSRFAAITASAIEPRLETCASCGVRIYEGGYYEEIDGQKMAFCCVHCAAAYKNESGSHDHSSHVH